MGDDAQLRRSPGVGRDPVPLPARRCAPRAVSPARMANALRSAPVAISFSGRMLRGESALGGAPCPIPALHTWLAAACFCERPGSRACRPAPFRASVEPRLRRCALGPPPVRLTLQSTRRCKSPPPPGGSAPPAPCWAGARESDVQPLSIGSAVAVGLCLVSRSRPSIPPSFRLVLPRAGAPGPPPAGRPFG